MPMTLTEQVNVAIRVFVDALSVHNFEQAERWADVAFELVEQQKPTGGLR